jgi:hypothetical protein
MRTASFFFAFALLMTSCSGPGSNSAEVTAGGAASSRLSSAEGALPDSAIRHVVIFKYQADAEEAQIAQITAAFRSLKDRIPGILSFENGVNNSPEGLNLGFTHAYVLTFENAAARDAYLPHPEHDAFGNLLSELGVVEEVFVVDYVPAP